MNKLKVIKDKLKKRKYPSVVEWRFAGYLPSNNELSVLDGFDIWGDYVVSIILDSVVAEDVLNDKVVI